MTVVAAALGFYKTVQLGTAVVQLAANINLQKYAEYLKIVKAALRDKAKATEIANKSTEKLNSTLVAVAKILML